VFFIVTFDFLLFMPAYFFTSCYWNIGSDCGMFIECY